MPHWYLHHVQQIHLLPPLPLMRCCCSHNKNLHRTRSKSGLTVPFRYLAISQHSHGNRRGRVFWQMERSTSQQIFFWLALFTVRDFSLSLNRIMIPGLPLGDYYYIKAGNELVTMGLANCTAKSAPLQSPPQNSSASPLAISFPRWWSLFVLWVFLIYR